MGQSATGHFDGSGTGIGAGPPSFRTVYGKYSYAVHGGGTGSYTLGNFQTGDRIIGGWVEVVGTPTAVSGTPTIAIQSEGANDIVTAASILGAPWSTTGKKAITPKINTPESTSISITQARNLVLAIATAAINTGEIEVYLIVAR